MSGKKSRDELEKEVARLEQEDSGDSSKDERTTATGQVQVVGGRRAVRRVATTDRVQRNAQPTKSPTRANSLGNPAKAHHAAKNKSDNNANNNPQPRSTSPKPSPFMRQGTAVTAKAAAAKAAAAAPTLKLESVVKNTSNLLDGLDSDLSDSADEFEDKFKSHMQLPKTTGHGGPTSSTLIDMEMLMRSESRTSTNVKQQKQMHDDSEIDDLDLSDALAPPPSLLQDFSLGVATVDLGKAKEEPGQRKSITTNDGKSVGKKKKGFWAMFLGGGSPNDSPKSNPDGSMGQWSGIGKRFRVDQSVNLMDTESGAQRPYQQSENQKRKSAKSFLDPIGEDGKKKGACSILLWILLALFPLVLMGVAFLLNDQIKDHDGPETTPTPGSRPPTSAQSLPPKTEETPAPNTNSTVEEQEKRWSVIERIMVHEGVTKEAEFKNKQSDAYKALKWLVHNYETLKINFIKDESWPLIQTYALAVVYFATNADVSVGEQEPLDWIQLEQGERPKVCHWTGIQCGHLHKVVGLNLTNRALYGTLPSQLAGMTHLIHLDLSHNSLGGTLPESLSELTYLSLLDLSDNQFEGKLPEGWELLRQQLDFIDLSQNRNLSGAMANWNMKNTENNT